MQGIVFLASFIFLLVGLALSRNWSLFLAVLIAIFLNHSPVVVPPNPLARSFAGFSLVGTFLYIFYSELPILVYFPPFLSTLQSQRHLSSGPLRLFSISQPTLSHSIIFKHGRLCYPKRMFCPLKAAEVFSCGLQVSTIREPGFQAGLSKCFQRLLAHPSGTSFLTIEIALRP